MKRAIYTVSIVAFAAILCRCRMFHARTSPEKGLENFVTYYRGELDGTPRTKAKTRKRICRVELSKEKSSILTIDEESGQVWDDVPLFEEYEVILSRPLRYGADGKLLSSEPVQVKIRDTETNLSKSFTIE